MSVSSFAPISVVRVLRNVSLNSNYLDTYYFSSASAQATFFAGKAKHTFNNVSPVRLPNTIRVDCAADDLFDCNYLMFQNANFSNKWFYAFITKIEWLNVNACTITYELDVLQTWLFDMDLPKCYIERKHSATDVKGDNLQPEPVSVTNYTFDNANMFSAFSQWSSVISYAVPSQDMSGEEGGSLDFTIPPAVTGKMMSPVYMYVVSNIDSQAVSKIKKWFDDANTKGYTDIVLGTFEAPTNLIPWSSVSGSASGVQTETVTPQFEHIGAYTPRNNKLFTFPYNYLCVFSSSGDERAYRYEYFNNSQTCSFELFSSLGSNCECVCAPTNYNGQVKNYKEIVVLQNIPQFAWVTDVYKAWAAQQGASIQTQRTLTVAGGVASMAANVATGNYIGAGMSAYSMGSSLQQSFAQEQAMKDTSDQAHGTQSANAMMTRGALGIYYANKHVRADEAKKIDEFFDAYGYAINGIGNPMSQPRPKWNYTKTNGCIVNGNIPFDDKAKISAIFDNGIRFWKTSTIGDFSGDNSPAITTAEELAEYEQAQT